MKSRTESALMPAGAILPFRSYFAFLGGLEKKRKEVLNLHALGIVGAHLLGFGALDFFGVYLQAYGTSVGMALVSVAGVGVGMSR